MQTSSSFSANLVLNALSPFQLELLAPHLTPCLLHLGQTLYERGEEASYLYFPKVGVISLVLTSQSGVDVEVGMIGREGALGAIETLGQHPMNVRAVVQVAGSGWRMPAHALREQYMNGSALQTTLLNSVNNMIKQTSQGVLCNRLHAVEQRLARWLLMCADRNHLDELETTHEFLASMIGTRRVGVTLAAGILREAGLIDYSRGHITITDRAGLEARTCECYATVRHPYLAPSTAPADGT